MNLLPGRNRTAWLAINGIRFKPGSARGWPERFCDWINCRQPDGVIADRREYYTTAITRFLRQRQRTDELARKVQRFKNAGYRVVLVGHSNGCDVIGRLLSDLGTAVASCHLIAPAAMETDFEDAILNNSVEAIHIYGSASDAALRLARVTRALVGWAGLGYGSLGLRGSEFAVKWPQVVQDHSNHDYGHSTWFDEGSTFESTMRLLIHNDTQDQHRHETHPAPPACCQP